MRIYVLDPARFVAAFSVVLYHYVSRVESYNFPLITKFTRFGYLGVPFFFLISGFVIMVAAKKRTAPQFLVSRMLRIYPTLWIAILFTISVGVLFFDESYSIKKILVNLALVNQFFKTPYIDEVYWTLVAEMKFYFCIFLLLLFGVFEKNRVWLSIWLGLTTVHLLTGFPSFMGWFISPHYSSFFIGGIAFFMIWSHGETKFNIFVVLASLVISTARAFEQTEHFLIDPSTLDKYLSVMIIWGFYLFFYLISIGKLQISGRNIYIQIGALTYPLYLIHARVGRNILERFSDVIPEKLLIILVTLTMLLVSYLIHRWLEERVVARLKAYLLARLRNSKK